MSRLPIGRRLAVCLSAITVLLLVVVAAGVSALRAAEAATARVAVEADLVRDAMQAKFRTADFVGWQTGYAFDSLRGVPDATSDGAGQRKEFLASTAAFREDLERLAGHRLTDGERADLEAAQQAFEEFLEVDALVIEGYRQGGGPARARADALVSGESLQIFSGITTSVDGVVTSARARSEAGAARARDAAGHDQRVMLVVGALALVLAVGLGTALTRSLTKPLGALTARLVAIADGDGDLTQRVDEARRDELGTLAAAFNRFAASMATAIGSIAGHASRLEESSRRLSSSSAQMADAAEETGVRAGTVSATAEQVSANVQTVAASSEEMGASIREISGNSAEASRVAVEAVALAGDTTAAIARLGESSTEIGNVVKVITSIAEQTNLLALNATIEAARAGEAGKGFAVVAGEVKELAQETARATEDISRRVEAIQSGTTGAVQAIEQISAVIARISDFQTTIAAAVEEQTATTSEVVRNVAEAATGAVQISASVSDVAAAARTTSAGAAQAQAAASELTRMSGDLEQVVGRFRYA